MFSLAVEMLGNIGKTEKGHIAQYLFTDEIGKKHVIKVFSKDVKNLPADGVITVKQDFFFSV